MFYIYILESESDNTYYVGYTDDVNRRFIEHNTSDHPTYTSKHRPWILKAVFKISDDRSVAMKVEKFIKRQKSRVFIDKICLLNIIELPMDQLVRVPKLRG